MSPMESVKTVLSKYATFTGRARRSEFWWFVAAYSVVYLVLYILAIALGAATASTDAFGNTTASPAAVIPFVLLGLVSLAVLVPYLAVTVRRLQDTDRDWYWIFISFVPFVGSLILLVFLVPEGTKGENRFGPDPKA